MRPLNGCAILALVLHALACHGCSDDFDPSSRVASLRLLAVQADRPSPTPGQRVELQALYYDPEGRALSWAWGPCASTASSSATGCAEGLDHSLLTIGSEPSFAFEVPARAGGESDSLGIVVVACPGTIAAGETAGIPLACLDAQGQPLEIDAFELGMKRLFVREQTENHNPTIDMILWDGEVWPAGEERESRCDRDSKKCRKHTLEVRIPEATIERRVDAMGNTSEEQVIVQFYGTGGTFEDDVRTSIEPDTTWQPRPEDRGRLLTLWFVVRDDRGGVGWSERRVRVP